MAQDNKGSDLSDLKSRLGLSEEEEQGEEQGDEGAPSGQQQAGRQQGQGPPAGGQRGNAPQGGPSGPQQGGPPQNRGTAGPGGPQSGGPPGGPQASGSAGPPQGSGGGSPQADRPPSGGPQGGGPPGSGGPTAGGGQDVSGFGDTAPDSGGPEQFEEPGSGLQPGSAVSDDASGGGAQARSQSFGDLDEGLESEEGLMGQGILTNGVLGLLGVVLVVGVVFGLIAMSSYQGRWLYNAQTDQAKRVLDALEPKVQNFQKAHKIIKDLNPQEVEYEKAKKLAELDFTMDMSKLATDKLLLGGQRINMLTSYLVQSERLQSLLKEHNRKTNRAEKKKLKKIEKIASGGKKGDDKSKKDVKMDHRYATVFSFDHLNSTGSDPQKYQPKSGQIVKIPKELEAGEDGKVKVELLNSGRQFKVDIRSIVPITRGQLLSVGGQNAFGRYQYRVSDIQHLSKIISQQTNPKMLIQKLKKLAERGSAPLIQL